MSSPNDNISLKDGGDTPFKMRSKDVSAAQDGSLQAVRHLATSYPVDYGVGGCFHLLTTSAAMAAGMSAASPIWGMRWTSSAMLAIIRRIRMTMWSWTTAFPGGLAEFDLMAARNWTTDDSGGTLITLPGNLSKMRATMGTSQMTVRQATTGALSAGTRTLDGYPFGQIMVGIGPAVTTVYQPRSVLYDKIGDAHPKVLAQNEGIILQATVPGGGTWGFSVEAEWDEVPLTNF
jgi:hypothetical protein